MIVYGSMASGPIRALVAGARHVWQLILQTYVQLSSQEHMILVQLLNWRLVVNISI